MALLFILAMFACAFSQMIEEANEEGKEEDDKWVIYLIQEIQ